MYIYLLVLLSKCYTGNTGLKSFVNIFHETDLIWERQTN